MIDAIAETTTLKICDFPIYKISSRWDVADTFRLKCFLPCIKRTCVISTNGGILIISDSYCCIRIYIWNN